MVQATYNSDEIVSLYASNTIPMFAPATVQSEILGIVRRNGVNDALGYAFSSYGNVLAPIAEQIANVAIENLHSNPTQVAAAVHMLYVLTEPFYRLRVTTANRTRRSLEDVVDGVITQQNEKGALWLARYLPLSKSRLAHAALWKLVDARLASEQSLICLTSLHDTRDLPRIAAIIEKYDVADPYGYHNSGVVGDLRYGYGAAARPYLREILDNSKQVWIRVAAAKELTLMGDSAGYQFFIQTLREHPFYYREMFEWLQTVFPAMRGSSEKYDDSVPRIAQNQSAPPCGTLAGIREENTYAPGIRKRVRNVCIYLVSAEINDTLQLRPWPQPFANACSLSI
jgi:hypothetical protein